MEQLKTHQCWDAAIWCRGSGTNKLLFIQIPKHDGWHLTRSILMTKYWEISTTWPQNKVLSTGFTFKQSRLPNIQTAVANPQQHLNFAQQIYNLELKKRWLQSFVYPSDHNLSKFEYFHHLQHNAHWKLLSQNFWYFNKQLYNPHDTN